jgi:hypothetical protein
MIFVFWKYCINAEGGMSSMLSQNQASDPEFMALRSEGPEVNRLDRQARI